MASITISMELAMTYRNLVAPDGGWVAPEIFSDQALYDLERQRIFGRSWLWLGHECQLPQPGSFLRTLMGDESVIVTRNRDGAVSAFLNACRHRGFEVCQEDRGVAHRFQCRYHGWTYGADGALIGVPGEETLYFRELDKRAWGLIPVARVETYKGLIFGNFDLDAPSLIDDLGDMAWYLDILLDRRAGGVVVLGPQRWRIAANWKVVAENHIGDEYHIGYAHGSMFPPDLGAARPAPLPFAREIRPAPGHGFGVDIYPDQATPRDWLSNGPLAMAPAHVTDYLLEIHEETAQRLGDQRARMAPIHGTVFPTLGMVPFFNTFRAIHPRGPREVEIWSYCVVDRDAPEPVKRWLADYSARAFGPAGGFEQDDAGNWTAVTRSSLGEQARRHRLNFQMGLGHETRSDRYPGEVGLTASEINQRGFYLRWAREMFGVAA